MDERLARVVAALHDCGADWAVLTAADSIVYALGYAPPIEAGLSSFAAGPTLAIIGRNGAAALLALEGEAAEPREGLVMRYGGYGTGQGMPATAAYAAAVTPLLKTLGVGGCIATELSTHSASVEALLPPGRRVDVTVALRHQRMTKTTAEIAALRRAAGVAAAGQRCVLNRLRAGITELALFGEVRAAMEAEAGARLAVMGDLLSGPARTAAIGGWPGPRVISPGDAVLADLAPRVDGYWGDSCATVVLGDATEGQMRLFAAARAALDHAVAEIRPGMTARDAHRMIRGWVQRAGFDYPHHTGHGIGASVHEHPRLCEGESEVLRAGMVLMVEPGAYDPAIGGARTEWMLHLTETGCVPLSPFPLVASVHV